MKRTILIGFALVVLIVGTTTLFSTAEKKHKVELEHLQSEFLRQLDAEKSQKQRLEDEKRELQEKNVNLEQQLSVKRENLLKTMALLEPVPVHTAAAVVSTGGSGSCIDEIKKYDWPHEAAIRIMNGESSGDPGILNHNPATQDYSVGCFQINLWGANAKSRPSEAELKKAEVNVAFAYKIYTGQGRTFCTSGGWINTCRKVGLAG